MTKIKYRRLTPVELQYFEKEFIDFLVLNGIAADDWEKIKKEEGDKAEELILIFSDMILEGTLIKTQYLEFIAKKKIASIHFQKDQMVLVAMEAPKDSKADFTDADFVIKATTNPPAELSIYTKNLPYLNPRERTIWDYINNGWYLSNGKLYKALCLGL